MNFYRDGKTKITFKRSLTKRSRSSKKEASLKILEMYLIFSLSKQQAKISL